MGVDGVLVRGETLPGQHTPLGSPQGRWGQVEGQGLWEAAGDPSIHLGHNTVGMVGTGP